MVASASSRLVGRAAAGYAASNDFARNPVGTGPYVFGGWSAGEEIALTVNEHYFTDSPKGVPIADAVTYRFVPDATTRVADLLSGNAQLVQGVPVDQVSAVEDGGQQVIAQQVSGAFSCACRIRSNRSPIRKCVRR
ncbi:MAG: ABC transporter substrate-binding protein [Thermomicrobiales bacterium]